MTFICCWRHLEAAVVTEAADIKATSESSKQHGGTEINSAVITIQEYTQGRCQVCGQPSLFSVYYQPHFRVPIEEKST